MNQIVKTGLLFDLGFEFFARVSFSKKKHIEQVATGKRIIKDRRCLVDIRFDDRCENGHNTFNITGTLQQVGHDIWRTVSAGSIHKDIAEFFPELAPYIKWHGVTSDGPLCYLSNPCYHASNRDHDGLLPGEPMQVMSGGVTPAWQLQVLVEPHVQWKERYAAEAATKQFMPLHAIKENASGDCPTAQPPTLVWAPWLTYGKGKERNLNAARSCAVWPEATDEDLMSDDLKQKLIDRFPALMRDFKSDMEALGFEYLADLPESPTC